MVRYISFGQRSTPCDISRIARHDLPEKAPPCLRLGAVGTYDEVHASSRHARQLDINAVRGVLKGKNRRTRVIVRANAAEVSCRSPPMT